jgi:hypothetical protein
VIIATNTSIALKIRKDVQISFLEDKEVTKTSGVLQAKFLNKI